MKRIYQTLCFALCAAALFSCQKELEQATETINEEVPEGYSKVTFTAECDGNDAPADEASKTSLNNAKATVWSSGDQIKLFWSGGNGAASLVSGSGTTSGRFQGNVPSGKTATYAVYPASITSSVSGSNVSVTVPATQTGSFAAGNIATASISSNSMNFFNTTSLLYVQFVSNDITKVVIESVDGSALAGTQVVSYASSSPSLGSQSSTTSTLTMTAEAAGRYYISILAGVTHAKGLKFTYYKGEEVSGVYYLNASFTTARNHIYEFGIFEPDKEYYVTVSGAGSKNGLSWGNAMSQAQMWSLLKPEGTDAQKDAAKVAAINGATFYLAAGDYNLGDSPNLSFDEEEAVALTFKGGYNASTGARDWEANATNITGGDAHACLNLSGKMDVTLDGLCFVHGKSSGDRQGALQCSGTGLSLTMNDCLVSNNINAQTSSTDAGAGMVVSRLGSFSATNVTFSYNTAYTAPGLYCHGTDMTLTDCVFDHNTATSYCGAVRIYHSTYAPTCTFANCTFTNNSAVNDYGALQHSKGTTNLNNCTFTDNSASMSGGHYGGAVGLNGTGSVVVRGGTYARNVAEYGGAFCSRTKDGNSAFLDVRDATISDNSARRGGGAFIDVLANFSRCAFTGNTANYGGAIAVHRGSAEKTARLQVYGGTFTNNSSKGGGAIFANSDDTDVTIARSNGVGTVFTGNHVNNGAYAVFGGAIRFESHSGTMSITGATFNGNYTEFSTEAEAFGGAISIASDQNGAKVNITECSFVENYGSGAAALSYQSGKEGNTDYGDSQGYMRVTDTEFIGNYSNYTDGTNNTNYGRHAGAVRLGHDATPSYFDNCTFKNNHALTSSSELVSACGGAITYYADGISYLNNCQFEGNYATRGGAISSWGCTASGLYLNGCSFSGNWCSYKNGTAIYVSRTKKFCMNNCSFNDNTYSTQTGNDSASWVYVDGNIATGDASSSDNTKYLEECVISNCSLIGCCRTGSSLTELTNDQQLLYILDMKSGKTCYLINNLIIDKGNSSHYGWWTNSITAKGYNNVYSQIGNTGGSYTASGDTGNKAAGDLGSLAWSTDDNTYTWNGTVNGGNTAITASAFATQVGNGSADFKTWLDTTLGVLEKDQCGTTRGSGSNPWWPGAYQEKAGEVLLQAITWNIRSSEMDDTGDHAWSARRGGMCAFINDRQPQIVCMQECEADQRSYLTSNCSGYSAIYDNTSLSWWQQFQGVDKSAEVILYKSSDISVQSSGTFWLVSGAPTSPSKSSTQNAYRSCTWMKCTYKGQKMLVMDVHLSYRTKDNSTPGSSEVIALRKTEMGVIKTWINGHYNASTDGWILFMGDMNTSHWEDIFDEWKDGTYGYFSREDAESSTTGRTYNDWDWENGHTSTIDFQFYKGFPSVKSYKIPTDTYSNVDYLSDHWPVVVHYRML